MYYSFIYLTRTRETHINILKQSRNPKEIPGREGEEKFM